MEKNEYILREREFGRLVACIRKQGFCEVNLLFNCASHYAAALILSVSMSLGGMIMFGTERINRTLYTVSPLKLFIGLLIIIIFYVLRETFQGIIWCMFTHNRLGSIRIWQCLSCNAVRCSVSDELKIGEYLWGLSAPLFLFTVVPFVSACIKNDAVTYLVGVCSLPACGNDMVTILNLLRHARRKYDIRVLIHPEKSGCLLYYR